MNKFANSTNFLAALLSRVVLALTLLVVNAQKAAATPLFGIVTQYSGTVRLAPETSLAVTDSISFSGPALEQTSFTLIPIELQDHVSGTLRAGNNSIVV